MSCGGWLVWLVVVVLVRPQGEVYFSCAPKHGVITVPLMVHPAPPSPPPQEAEEQDTPQDDSQGPVGAVYTAVHDYGGAGTDGFEDDVLTFATSETIELLEVGEDGWWRGRLTARPHSSFATNEIQLITVVVCIAFQTIWLVAAAHCKRQLDRQECSYDLT
jgi:hypothetical protein